MLGDVRSENGTQRCVSEDTRVSRGAELVACEVAFSVRKSKADRSAVLR